MKRVRGGKEDSYRWLRAANTPNSPQFGTIGDTIAPFPYVSVGGLVSITTDVNMPDVAPSDTGIIEIWQYYNPIEDLPSQQSGFMPMGVSIIVGQEATGLTPPTGNITAKFALALSTISEGSQITIWRSIAKTMNGAATRNAFGSITPVDSDVQLAPVPMGVNSYNATSSLPYDQMNLLVLNQSGVTTLGAGGFRLVVWGLEF